jgi:integrase
VPRIGSTRLQALSAGHLNGLYADLEQASAHLDRDLVFADPVGAPIHPQRLTDCFSEHRQAAGLSTGTLHVPRHTAATLALTHGVPVHIVSARLGDPKTTLATYAHLLPQSDEVAAERIAGALVSAS